MQQHLWASLLRLLTTWTYKYDESNGGRLGPHIQVIFSSLIYSFIIKIVVEVMIAKSK